DVHGLEEIRLELLQSVTLAGFAASARHIEGEGARVQSERLGPWQPREELADLVEGLDVGDGVRARGAADGLLVDEVYTLEELHAADLVVHAGAGELDLEVPGQRAIQGVVDEGGLPRPRHAGDAGQGMEGDAHVQVLEIVLARSSNDEGAAPFPAGQRQRRVIATAP